jgi:hypothetical protein
MMSIFCRASQQSSLSPYPHMLIGENCAILSAEDLGYSDDAMEMRVPAYHAPGETVGLAKL